MFSCTRDVHNVACSRVVLGKGPTFCRGCWPATKKSLETVSLDNSADAHEIRKHVSLGDQKLVASKTAERKHPLDGRVKESVFKKKACPICADKFGQLKSPTVCKLCRRYICRDASCSGHFFAPSIDIACSSVICSDCISRADTVNRPAGVPVPIGPVSMEDKSLIADGTQCGVCSEPFTFWRRSAACSSCSDHVCCQCVAPSVTVNSLSVTDASMCRSCVGELQTKLPADAPEEEMQQLQMALLAAGGTVSAGQEKVRCVACSKVDTPRRQCSECLREACLGCSRPVLLQSLGEKETRILCAPCQVAMRARVSNKGKEDEQVMEDDKDVGPLVVVATNEKRAAERPISVHIVRAQELGSRPRVSNAYVQLASVGDGQVKTEEYHGVDDPVWDQTFVVSLPVNGSLSAQLFSAGGDGDLLGTFDVALKEFDLRNDQESQRWLALSGGSGRVLVGAKLVQITETSSQPAVKKTVVERRRITNKPIKNKEEFCEICRHQYSPLRKHKLCSDCNRHVCGMCVGLFMLKALGEAKARYLCLECLPGVCSDISAKVDETKESDPTLSSRARKEAAAVSLSLAGNLSPPGGAAEFSKPEMSAIQKQTVACASCTEPFSRARTPNKCSECTKANCVECVKSFRLLHLLLGKARPMNICKGCWPSVSQQIITRANANPILWPAAQAELAAGNHELGGGGSRTVNLHPPPSDTKRCGICRKKFSLFRVARGCNLCETAVCGGVSCSGLMYAPELSNERASCVCSKCLPDTNVSRGQMGDFPPSTYELTAAQKEALLSQRECKVCKRAFTFWKQPHQCSECSDFACVGCSLGPFGDAKDNVCKSCLGNMPESAARIEAADISSESWEDVEVEVEGEPEALPVPVHVDDNCDLCANKFSSERAKAECSECRRLLCDQCTDDYKFSALDWTEAKCLCSQCVQPIQLEAAQVNPGPKCDLCSADVSDRKVIRTCSDCRKERCHACTKQYRLLAAGEIIARHICSHCVTSYENASNHLVEDDSSAEEEEGECHMCSKAFSILRPARSCNRCKRAVCGYTDCSAKYDVGGSTQMRYCHQCAPVVPELQHIQFQRRREQSEASSDTSSEDSKAKAAVTEAQCCEQCSRTFTWYSGSRTCAKCDNLVCTHRQCATKVSAPLISSEGRVWICSDCLPYINEPLETPKEALVEEEHKESFSVVLDCEFPSFDSDKYVEDQAEVLGVEPSRLELVSAVAGSTITTCNLSDGPDSDAAQRISAFTAGVGDGSVTHVGDSKIISATDSAGVIHNAQPSLALKLGTKKSGSSSSSRSSESSDEGIDDDEVCHCCQKSFGVLRAPKRCKNCQLLCCGSCSKKANVASLDPSARVRVCSRCENIVEVTSPRRFMSPRIKSPKAKRAEVVASPDPRCCSCSRTFGVFRSIKHCSECDEDGCSLCVGYYRLQSLDENDPRHVCKKCLPGLQHRLLAVVSSNKTTNPELSQRAAKEEAALRIVSFGSLAHTNMRSEFTNAELKQISKGQTLCQICNEKFVLSCAPNRCTECSAIVCQSCSAQPRLASKLLLRKNPTCSCKNCWPELREKLVNAQEYNHNVATMIEGVDHHLDAPGATQSAIASVTSKDRCTVCDKRYNYFRQPSSCAQCSALVCDGSACSGRFVVPQRSKTSLNALCVHCVEPDNVDVCSSGSLALYTVGSECTRQEAALINKKAKCSLCKLQFSFWRRPYACSSPKCKNVVCHSCAFVNSPGDRTCNTCAQEQQGLDSSEDVRLYLGTTKPTAVEEPSEPQEDLGSCPVCERPFGVLRREYTCSECCDAVCAGCSAGSFSSLILNVDCARICRPCLPGIKAKIEASVAEDPSLKEQGVKETMQVDQAYTLAGKGVSEKEVTESCSLCGAGYSFFKKEKICFECSASVCASCSDDCKFKALGRTTLERYCDGCAKALQDDNERERVRIDAEETQRLEREAEEAKRAAEEKAAAEAAREAEEKAAAERLKFYEQSANQENRDEPARVPGLALTKSPRTLGTSGGIVGVLSPRYKGEPEAQCPCCGDVFQWDDVVHAELRKLSAKKAKARQLAAVADARSKLLAFQRALTTQLASINNAAMGELAEVDQHQLAIHVLAGKDGIGDTDPEIHLEGMTDNVVTQWDSWLQVKLTDPNLFTVTLCLASGGNVVIQHDSWELGTGREEIQWVPVSDGDGSVQIGVKRGSPPK